MNSRVLLGVYPHFDEFLKSVRELRKQGFKDLMLYSPTARHELEEVLESEPSPVTWFTLTGALLGLLSGFTMTIWMSNDWPMIVGGKPIGGWNLEGVHGFTVPMFELTILFGAMFTLVGLLINARLPSIRLGAYDPRFSDDHFGIEVRTTDEQANAAESILEKFGAKEVKRV
jgi:hypothetical protein